MKRGSGTRSPYHRVCHTLRVRPAYLLFALVSLLPLWGCAPPAPSDGGVTTGGQQDIAAARQAIEQGDVPDPDAISVEGLLSEHSIPLTVDDDGRSVYVAATTAWHHDFDAFTPLASVHLGFGTTMTAEELERPPLNLCLVIDRSGSMDNLLDQRTGTTKMEAVRVAVDRMLGQLTADDRVSITGFNENSRTYLDGAAGNDVGAIRSALREIDTDGGTDLAAGLSGGYRRLAEHTSSTRLDRLLVFTDARLTYAETRDVRNFISVMEDYADQGMGVTFLGLGSRFGDEVAYEISQVRGGNYFFLSDLERINQVLDDEFDYNVTPLAYDVTLTVTVPDEFSIVDVYGIPFDEDDLNSVVELKVATLFFSAREGGGAITVRLRASSLADFSKENTIAEIDMAYTSQEGQRLLYPQVNARLPAGLDEDATTDYFADDAAQRATLLVNTALVMQHACADIYRRCYDPFFGYYYYCGYGGRSTAESRLTEFLPYFDALAEGLTDRPSSSSRSLSEERAVVAQLLENVRRYF